MSNTRKVIERLFWGVDFKLLNQCVDEKVRFIKYEVLILIITSISAYSIFSYTKDLRLNTTASTITAIIVVFFTYKMYLSNLHNKLMGHCNGFLQWLITTLFAIITACGIITSIANIRIDTSIGTKDVIVMVVTTTLSLILFYIPVRFNADNNSQYAKLLKKTLDEENSWAELAINDELQQKTQRRKAQSELNKKVEKLSTDMIATEIAKARTRVAKAALEKWEAKQKELINQDIEHYIKS